MVHQTWVGAPDAVNGNGIEAFEPGATLWLAQSTVPEIQFTASLHSPAELPKAMATVTSLLTWSAHRKPKQRRQAVSSRRLQSAGGAWPAPMLAPLIAVSTGPAAWRCWPQYAAPHRGSAAWPRRGSSIKTPAGWDSPGRGWVNNPRKGSRTKRSPLWRSMRAVEPAFLSVAVASLLTKCGIGKKLL